MQRSSWPANCAAASCGACFYKCRERAVQSKIKFCDTRLHTSLNKTKMPEANTAASCGYLLSKIPRNKKKELYRRQRKKKESLERFYTRYKNNNTVHFVIVSKEVFSLETLFGGYHDPGRKNFIDNTEPNSAGAAGTLAQLSLRNLGASSVQSCVKKFETKIKNNIQIAAKKNTRRQPCKIQEHTATDREITQEE